MENKETKLCATSHRPSHTLATSSIKIVCIQVYMQVTVLTNPPMDPTVGDLPVQIYTHVLHDLRTSHLYMDHIHGVHTQLLCWRAIVLELAEPKDGRSILCTIKITISTNAFLLFHIYEYWAVAYESPHLLGYSLGNALSFLWVSDYHVHGHSRANV